MKRIARITALLVATIALWSPPVLADSVFIGLAQGAAAPTTVAFSAGAATITMPFGTFSNVHVSAQGQSTLTPPDLLFSDTIDTSSATAGILHIFVTDLDLISPLGAFSFFSSFTSNTLPNGWTLTTNTYFSPTNALYRGTPLATHTFSTIGVDEETAQAPTQPGLYSVTEEFVINATGAGDSNDTIDLSATTIPVPTPEPSSFALLLCGLFLLLLRRRVGKIEEVGIAEAAIR